MLTIHNPYDKDLAKRRQIFYLNLGNNPLRCVPIWMEGPHARWYKSIPQYTKLYDSKNIGYCTLCPRGEYAATFDNEGEDCQPCPAGLN